MERKREKVKRNGAICRQLMNLAEGNMKFFVLFLQLFVSLKLYKNINLKELHLI